MEMSEYQLWYSLVAVLATSAVKEPSHATTLIEQAVSSNVGTKLSEPNAYIGKLVGYLASAGILGTERGDSTTVAERLKRNS